MPNGIDSLRRRFASLGAVGALLALCLPVSGQPLNLCRTVAGVTVSLDSYRGLSREWMQARRELAAAGRLPDRVDSRAYWTAGTETLEAIAGGRLIDGDMATYWYAGSRKTSVTIAFPEPVAVSQSAWIHSEGIPAGRLDERGLKDYDIWTSTDGEQWSLACSVRNYLGGRKHDTFAARRARHVRLDIRQVQGFLLPVLVEWQLYDTPGPIPADQTQWAERGVPPILRITGPELSAEVTTDKLLYRPGEDAHVTVRLRNSGRHDRHLHVQLRHRCGIEPSTVLAQWDVKLQPARTESLTHTLRSVEAEYGHHVRAELSENGQGIDDADGVFEVAESWAKIARMVNDIAWDKCVPDLPLAEITEVHIPLWRKLYVNSVEFAGNYRYYSQLDTDEETWGFPAPYARRNLMSAETIRRWTRAGREHGIRVCTYVETGALSPELELAERRPDWLIHGPIVYPQRTASLHALWLYFGARLDQAFPPGQPVTAPDLHMFDYGNVHAMTDALAEDIGQAAARFGWEGAMFDSFPWALECSAFGRDRAGDGLDGVSADDVGAGLLKRIREQVRRRTGRDFAVVANFGVPQGLTPWHEQDPDLAAFREHRAIYRQTAAQLGAFMLEQHPTPHIWSEKDPLGRFIYPQTIEDTVRALRLIREANDVGVPVTLHPCQYNRRKNCAVLDAHMLFSCAYASGVLLHTTLGTPPRSLLAEPLSSEPVRQVEANYNRFAARYGEYLFDLGIRWLPQGQVTCDAPENVWWDGLASFRGRADGTRDVYVHLINRAAVPLAWGAELAEPDPVPRLPVSIREQEGRRLAGVWCLSPNGSQDPRELASERVGGSYRLTVPRLEYWTMLVCRFGGAE